MGPAVGEIVCDVLESCMCCAGTSGTSGYIKHGKEHVLNVSTDIGPPDNRSGACRLVELL